MTIQKRTFLNPTRSNGSVISTGKPVLIQVSKFQIWRTILCAQGQKG
jgi:hypothetical protein